MHDVTFYCVIPSEWVRKTVSIFMEFVNLATMTPCDTLSNAGNKVQIVYFAYFLVSHSVSIVRSSAHNSLSALDWRVNSLRSDEQYEKALHCSSTKGHNNIM